MTTTLTTVSLANTPDGPYTQGVREAVGTAPPDGLADGTSHPPMAPGTLPDGNSVYLSVVADFRVTYDNPLQPSSIPQTNRFTCDADPSLYSSVENPEFEWFAVKNCIPYNPLYDPNLPIFGVSDPMNQQVAQVMNIDGFPLDPPGGPVMDNGPVVIGLKVTDTYTGDSSYREYTYSTAGVLLAGPNGPVYPPIVKWRAVRRKAKTFAFRNNSRPGSNPIASYTIYYGDGQDFTYTGPNAESTNPGVNGRHHYKDHGVYDVVIVMTDTVGEEIRETLTVHTNPDPSESVPSFEIGIQLTNVAPPPEFGIVDDNPGGVDNGNTLYAWYQIQFTNDGLAGVTAQTQEDKDNQNIRRTTNQEDITIQWAFYRRPTAAVPVASFEGVGETGTRLAYRFQDVVNAAATMDHYTVLATSTTGARYVVNRTLDRLVELLEGATPSIELVVNRIPATKEVFFTPTLYQNGIYQNWTPESTSWCFDVEYMNSIRQQGMTADPDYQAYRLVSGPPSQQSFVYNLRIPNRFFDFDDNEPNHSKKVGVIVTLRNPNPPASNIQAVRMVKGFFHVPVQEWLWPNPVGIITHTAEPTGVVPFRGVVYLGVDDQSVRNPETKANLSRITIRMTATGSPSNLFTNAGTCVVYDQYRRQIDREQGVPAAQVNYFPQEYQNTLGPVGLSFNTSWDLRYDGLRYTDKDRNVVGTSNRNNDDWARFRNEWGTPLTRPLGTIVPPEGTYAFRRTTMTDPQPAWDDGRWNKFYSTFTNPANGRSITGNGYRPSFPMSFAGCQVGDKWKMTWRTEDVLGERCDAFVTLEVQDDVRYGAAATGQYTFGVFNALGSLVESHVINSQSRPTDYELVQPTYEPLDPAGFPPNPDDDVIVQPVPSPPPTP